MRGWLAALLLLGGGAGGIAWLQPPLAERARSVKQGEDVYVLPPPDELKVMTLGYRAAAADLLWAKLLVEFGMHWFDKRPFTDVPKYVDAILTLEPDHRLVYRYVDTLLVFRPPQGTEADAVMARAYLERGTRERPFDPEVWQKYGDFMAFVAPSFVKDTREHDAWRREGARALERAVQLGAEPSRALSAATILSKSGERKAAIAFLRRAYWVTDDADTREQITAKLQLLESSPDERDVAYIDSEWSALGHRRGRSLLHPLLSRGELLLLGPFVDPKACAGVREPKLECERDWEARLPSNRGK